MLDQACYMNCYRSAVERLKAHNISEPDLAVRFFFKFGLQISYESFLYDEGSALTNSQAEQLSEFVERHIAGEPVSRIIGSTEFWGLPFKVTPFVLDPRPESETLIEAVVNKYKDMPKPETILDLGTGSGCLLISLLNEFSNSEGVGLDFSFQALECASENAQLNKVDDRIIFIQGDWDESIGKKFDLVISNPPYIPNQDIESLDVSVKNHDPILALDGGIDGVESYKKIFSRIISRLNAGGAGFFEIGINQLSEVKRLVEDVGANLIRVHHDLSGIPRVVEISSGDK
jgi:release factor glutamine methyltransferase